MFNAADVDQEVRRIGMPNYGDEIVSPWHDQPATVDFADAVDKSFPYA